MRGLAAESTARRLEDEAKEEEKQAKRQKAEEKKAAAALAAEEREAAFARCEIACACGVVPCPWAGFVRCPTCGPKKGQCRVRVCAAARAPLLLGYNPAVGAAEGAAGAAEGAEQAE